MCGGWSGGKSLLDGQRGRLVGKSISPGPSRLAHNPESINLHIRA